ncbi:MAG TPA: GTP 3',8-cyclase MoaA [Candidatus Dormibacteraeota bacterium]|nr:GTP 3',8-cyclase MoaA [Candidatus Dormibacteraeota bacterium]
MDGSPLRDRYGRLITYLRVSVTERCNLRCFYCLPRGAPGCERRPQSSLDELAEAVSVGVSLGISKLRVTGGEPLVRPGTVDFVRQLARLDTVTDLALTTNGTLLAEYAAALKGAGLHRVNVSLDSLRPEVFRAISGRNDLGRVLDGIAAAKAAGLTPIKLNVVVTRGVNDGELLDMLDFAAGSGAQMRFIEYMPIGIAQRWARSYVSRAEIVERLRPRLADVPASRRPGDTATYFALRAGGEVGVISPVSCRFCELCNRLRLTADARLRPCLTSEGEVDLSAALRPLVHPARLAQGFRDATAGRPRQGSYLVQTQAAAIRPMAAIGG